MLALKCLIAKERFQGSGPFDKKTGIKLVRHPNAAVHLDHLIGHSMQEITGMGFRK